jgi:hypothetical protein
MKALLLLLKLLSNYLILKAVKSVHFYLLCSTFVDYSCKVAFTALLIVEVFLLVVNAHLSRVDTSDQLFN